MESFSIENIQPEILNNVEVLNECCICLNILPGIRGKVHCERCTFVCCRDCYTQLSNVKCPVCRYEKFNIDYLYRMIEYYKFENIRLTAGYTRYIENVEDVRMHYNYKNRFTCLIFIITVFILIVIVLIVKLP